MSSLSSDLGLTAARAGWSRAQRIKNDLLWTAAIAALRSCGVLSGGSLRAVGRFLGATAFVAGGAPRAIALGNVGRVFPELDARRRRELVRSAYVHLGEALGDTVDLFHRPLREPLHVPKDTVDAFAEARLAGGGGVIFASAHLGAWEHVAAAVVAAGVPLTAVVRDSYDPRFARVHERVRRHAGIGCIRRGASSASAGLAVARALRRGEVVGIPMDLRSRVVSCEIPFLGLPAPTPVGPARLALRLRAAVLVGSLSKQASGRPSVTVTRIPTDELDDRDDAAIELTRRINDELSRRIRAMPEHWVWMHPRWNGSLRGMMPGRKGAA